MKKIVFLIIGLFILLACSDNSNEPISKNKYISDLIIGKWMLDSSYVNGIYTEDGKSTIYVFLTDNTMRMVDPKSNHYIADFEINNGDSSLILFASTGNITKKILQLNDSILIWDCWYDNDIYIYDYLHRVPF